LEDELEGLTGDLTEWVEVRVVVLTLIGRKWVKEWRTGRWTQKRKARNRGPFETLEGTLQQM